MTVKTIIYLGFAMIWISAGLMRLGLSFESNAAAASAFMLFILALIKGSKEGAL